MRQVWITKKGGPSVLQVREAADPAPAAGEVRVRVAAAGINFADRMARMGLYPDAPKIPCVVGYEVSGTVDAVGAGVDDVAVGTRVVALTRFGGYSDVVCVPRIQVATIEDHISFEAAAAIPVQYLTAWLMLVRLGNIRKGDHVLVHAAAGGVGQAALQICQHKGAIVYGTASPGKHARLQEMGCDHTIDYRSQDFETEVMRLSKGRGVDIALDAVGGESWKKSYRCLRPMGRLFAFGASSFSAGEKLSIPTVLKGLMHLPKYKPMDLMGDNKGVIGINVGHLWDQAEELTEMLQEVLVLVHDGTFEPVVDATFSFAQAAEAHAYMGDRKNFGKVLLTP